jgi:hypothetical protein
VRGFFPSSYVEPYEEDVDQEAPEDLVAPLKEELEQGMLFSCCIYDVF